MDLRVGIGYDIHGLIEGRPLMLGGVKVSYERGLKGHSDGDALLHAVGDAMLGAAALGDIGMCFPDTDPKYKDADSKALLKTVCDMVLEAGWRPVNIDVNVIAEKPKLAPHLNEMRKSLAGIVSLPFESVSIKARTNEGLDAVGRGEAIAVQAVVLVERCE